MGVLIGHAVGDENGRAHAGQAGDQTGKEVCIRPWYAGGWNLVLRPLSEEAAERMAAACEILCKGNLVGYDQWQRNGLWDELERVGWDPARLAVKCETDCSALMTACARVAGIDVPRVRLGNGQLNAPVTSTMGRAFGATGAFELLADAKYLSSDQWLRRGDVLVKESGHTAMALENGFFEEENMTGEQIYDKLNAYLRERPVPDWAKAELEQAVAMGITDGTRPMELIPRYQAAIMAKRAGEKAKA